MGFWQWYSGWLKGWGTEWVAGVALAITGLVMGLAVMALASAWYLWFLLCVPIGVTLMAHANYRREQQPANAGPHP